MLEEKCNKEASKTRSISYSFRILRIHLIVCKPFMLVLSQNQCNTKSMKYIGLLSKKPFFCKVCSKSPRSISLIEPHHLLDVALLLVPFNTKCPGLGGTSPLSHIVALLPNTNSIVPPFTMMSSCSNQFFFQSCPFIFTDCT